MTHDSNDDATSWAVYRQDDNGHRFLVRAGFLREEAARLAGELEGRGHEQLCWIEPERSADGRPRPRGDNG